MTYRDEEVAQRCLQDDLERELTRLEARLAEMGTLTGEKSRVIAELARVREDLAQRADRRAPLRLADLKIASPCNQRWADMLGDDRVRVCNGCDRPVFDLSEMTTEQAEAVLATRGLTPCVRFYRRDDGTVMTTDCPTGARKKRRKLAVVAGAMAAVASAAGALMMPQPSSAVAHTPAPLPAPVAAVVTPPNGPPHEPIGIGPPQPTQGLPDRVYEVGTMVSPHKAHKRHQR